VEILFNSDRTKDRLYAIDLDTYMDMTVETGLDEARWMSGNAAEGKLILRRQRPPP
jgi:hypothetical protein